MRKLLDNTGLMLVIINAVYLGSYFINKLFFKDFINKDLFGLLLVILLISYQWYLYGRK